MPLALMTGIHSIPHMSPSSTSTILDDKDQYKYYWRLIPSDTGLARAMIDYLRINLNVYHVGVVHLNDAHGTGFNNALKDHNCKCVEIRSFSFNSGNKDEMKIAIKLMKETGFKVFIFIFFYDDQESFFTEAYEQGIVGPGYFWLTGDGDLFMKNRYKKTSVLANFTQGMGQIKAVGTLPSESDTATGYDRFIKAWDSQNDQSISYYNCKQAQDVANLTCGDMSNFEDRPINPHTLYVYDFVMALGLAACELSSRKGNGDYFDGPELYRQVIQTEFEGASGHVLFDPKTASREPSSVVFALYNMRKIEPSSIDDDYIFYSKDIVMQTIESPDVNHSVWKNVEGEAFIYLDGTTNPPNDLPPVEHDFNYLWQIRFFGLAVSGIVLLTSLLFGLWTIIYRGTNVVKMSQPIFLIMICVGTFIMGCSIIFSTIDDSVASDRVCSILCMVDVWFLVIGFSTIFSALFAKIWRINKIMNVTRFTRVVVTVRDAMVPFVTFLTVNTIILLCWTFISPLEWKRVPVEGKVDVYGRSTASYGRCDFSQSYIYAAILAVFNFTVLGIANYQAYCARNVSTDLSENKYITISMVCITQVFMLGLPILLLVEDKINVSYFCKVIIIFLATESTLLLIFVPKIMKQKQIKEKPEGTGQQVNTQMRATRKYQVPVYETSEVNSTLRQE
eukprot:CAMPEP_0172519418 /NCGR_PEP_ID=MMETSP1066-20121228/291408_1 /TAXON_ID=671091 /ORGANISM="Coscinodiscus wailesii, Strain CCMP2513" /LENGTH=674 /DNA_ID=CAMNT_0013302005 /DNA_START=692 /DNA_END=2716 /DNA_ORIENTATION=-